MNYLLKTYFGGLVITGFLACMAHAGVDCTVVISTVSATEILRTETCVTQVVLNLDEYLEALKRNRARNLYMLQSQDAAVNQDTAKIDELTVLKETIALSTGTVVVENPEEPVQP